MEAKEKEIRGDAQQNEGAHDLRHMIYLLLELSQLSRQVGHQPHGRLQLLLQVPDLILLALCVAAHQRHGTHPREPVQVVLLWATKHISH